MVCCTEKSKLSFADKRTEDDVLRIVVSEAGLAGAQDVVRETDSDGASFAIPSGSR
jgi:hypothetical protein